MTIKIKSVLHVQLVHHTSFWCKLSPRSDFDVMPIFRKLMEGKSLKKQATLLQKADSNSCLDSRTYR